uniref:Transfer protein traSA n=2 Tax=Nonomuraea gerenzanensis TaxID=93944 RepID=A0A1M4BLA9_9ACTN|nr:hypothetical protein BN4615_P10987 [Nonomuraea gerenzanensis]
MEALSPLLARQMTPRRRLGGRSRAKDWRQAARTRQRELRKARKEWRRDRRRTIYQGRSMVRPIVWLAGMQAGAWVCSWLPYGWAVSLLGATIGAVAVIGLRRASYPMAGLGWLWMVAANVFGPFGWHALTLWLAGVGFAIPYWHRNHTSLRPGHEQPPEAGREVSLRPEQTVWLRRVAVKGKPLDGTTLGAPATVPGGWTARIHGVPGTHDLDTFTGQLVKIASAFGVSRDQVSIEATPERNENEAQITVLRTVENLDQVRFMEDHDTGIDERGISLVGFFGDMNPTRVQNWTQEGGVRFALIAGGSGSGKSRFVEGLIARVHVDRRGVNFLIDAQGGQSQPDWNGRVYRTARGVEEGFYELRRLDWQMKRRAELFAGIEWVDEQGRPRRGWTHLVPHEAFPMMQVIVEEAPLLFESEEVGDDAAELIAAGAKTWRKAGGRLVLVTQLPSVEELKKQSIRSMLRSNGDVISFRTGDSVSQNMLGMQNDPSKLPEHFSPSGNHTKGLGYIVGIDRRQAMWRSMIPRDPYGIALQEAAGVLDEFTVRAGLEFDANPDNPGQPPKRTSDVDAARHADGVHRLLVEAGRVLDYAELLKATTTLQAGGLTMPQLDATLRHLAAHVRVLPTDDGRFLPLVDGRVPATT